MITWSRTAGQDPEQIPSSADPLIEPTPSSLPPITTIIAISMSYHYWTQPILQEIPSCFTVDEADLLSRPQSLVKMAPVYDQLIQKHGPHPFLLVSYARALWRMDSASTALEMCQLASKKLQDIGICDPKLDELIRRESSVLDDRSRHTLSVSRSLNYAQKWRPTEAHRYPSQYKQPPLEPAEIRSTWNQFFPRQSVLLRRYLDAIAIETNRVEDVFVIIDSSAQDLVRQGVDSGTLRIEGHSAIYDDATIRTIIKDTVAAYELLSPVVQDPTKLNADFIKSVHCRLMQTCRFSKVYIPSGRTRTETKQTVLISGASLIECCPYPEVDEELDRICCKAKEYIANAQDAFASASWLHLALARCHPFNDGNGRTTRLVASIPLLIHGYPPISILLEQREDYYTAINAAYEGDHGPLIHCMMSGVADTIKLVQNL